MAATNDFSQFPFVKILHDEPKATARIYEVIEILGNKYPVWDYDWHYILLACKLANKWQPEQRTFERIAYLRSWIRENAQHMHGLDYSRCRSMGSVKRKIADAIKIEYRHCEDKESAAFALKRNEEIFA